MEKKLKSKTALLTQELSFVEERLEAELKKAHLPHTDRYSTDQPRVLRVWLSTAGCLCGPQRRKIV